MRDHVPVGMPREPSGVLEAHPAEHELTQIFKATQAGDPGDRGAALARDIK